MSPTDKQELYAEAQRRELADLPAYDDITEAELRARLDADDPAEPSSGDELGPDDVTAATPTAGAVGDPAPAANARAELIDEASVVDAPAAAGTVVTTATPAADDAHPAIVGDARPDDGTVRTNSAVEPVADALVAGAGAPAPPPANVDADGRERFEGGVAPTARADYDGPGAPAGQDADAVDAAQHGGDES